MLLTVNGLWNFSARGREDAGLLHVPPVARHEGVRDKGGGPWNFESRSHQV